MSGSRADPAPAVVPFGDRALLVDTADMAAAHALATVLDGRIATGAAPVGIEEVVVGFASVVVVLAAQGSDLGACAAWVAKSTSGPSAVRKGGRPPRTHVLPVVFDGADLAEVAIALCIPVDQVVDQLVSARLEVAFVGFAPGFPYLTGLPAGLAALPRRPSPRTSVPAGSVAVAGGFASVYPRSTPGGWHLLGRTAESLFDPDVAPHSRVAPGDRVRFAATDAPVPEPPTDTTRPPLVTPGPCLEVLEPGLATTVQDGGRRGCAHLGVPAAGAADPRSLALANLVVGNPADAAGLECTASGPTLRMVGDGHLTVVGAGDDAVDVTVDGHPVPDGTVLPLADGQVVRIGRVRAGLRVYVAVAGGLETPVVLGSRSSDSLAGLGPGPLRAGDRLARGTPGRARGRIVPEPGRATGPTVLRVVAGPHGSPGDGLTSTTWRVGSAVDRIGARLEAVDGSVLAAGGPRPSMPMVTGAVQVPPDGRPIVLLPDHATVGGYPVVACVVTADLGPLGQLRPGDEVAFVEVDQAGAAGARDAAARATASRVTGWFPTVAGT